MIKQWKISLIAFLFIFLFGISCVSAYEFDNHKSIQNTIGKAGYPDIKIENAFGLGRTLWEGTLDRNTEYCGINCEAEQTIILEEPGTLIDDIQFYTIDGKDRYLQNINSYQINLKIGEEEYEIDDYEYQCHVTKINVNGSESQECISVKVGSHIETKDLWREYNLGEEVDAGTYVIQLIGSKNPEKTVDWVIKTNGEWLDEWATWTSSFYTGLFSVHTFDRNTTGNDINVTYNLSDNSGGVIWKIENLETENNCKKGNCTGSPPEGMVAGNNLQFDYDPFAMLNASIDATGTGNLTVSFWWNLNGSAQNTENSDGYAQIFGRSIDATAKRYLRTYYADDTNEWIHIDIDGLHGESTTEVYAKETWHHMVIVVNGSDYILYVNGTQEIIRHQDFQTDMNLLDINTLGEQTVLFDGTGATSRPTANLSLDELYMWNRQLSDAEISDLYNDGVGIFWDAPSFVITLVSPIDGYVSPIEDIPFNCSAETFAGNTIVNMSLFHNGTGTWERILNVSLTGTLNNTIFTTEITDYTLWNCEACDSTDSCISGDSNRTVSSDANPPEVTIISPQEVEDYGYDGYYQILNWSISDANLESIWYDNETDNVTLSGIDNSTSFEIYKLLDGQNYTLVFYANDTLGNLNNTYLYWNYKVFENTRTHNETSYETAYENYLINVTANSTLTAVQLNYNGSLYSMTDFGSGIWKSARDVAVSDLGNNSISFNFTYAGEIFESDMTTYQDVQQVVFALCNSTLNISYLNFTFKDETTGYNLNVTNDLTDLDYWIGNQGETISYITNSVGEEPSYAFCLEPSDQTLNINLSFKYSKVDYPLRTFSYDSKTLTNSSTDVVLYLLSSTDGIYTTFQVLDAGTNNPIEGVEVLIEREIGGVMTLIGQGITDASGSITFWVNPNYAHLITATKTGYAGVQETITPTQSSYTLFMGTSADVSVPDYIYQNILFYSFPQAGRLEPETVYAFGMNITAADENVVSCKMEVRNLTRDIVASVTGCDVSGGTISVNYDTGTNNKLFGYYYLDLGDGLVLFKANDAWFIESLNTSSSSGGLSDMFSELRDLPEWGDEHNRQEFSRIVFFFFIMILLIGIFTFFSGNELTSAGSAIVLVWFFMALGSISNFLYIAGLTPYTWMNQYGLFLITTFFLGGLWLNTIRKENS